MLITKKFKITALICSFMVILANQALAAREISDPCQKDSDCLSGSCDAGETRSNTCISKDVIIMKKGDKIKDIIDKANNNKSADIVTIMFDDSLNGETIDFRTELTVKRKIHLLGNYKHSDAKDSQGNPDTLKLAPHVILSGHADSHVHNGHFDLMRFGRSWGSQRHIATGSILSNLHIKGGTDGFDIWSDKIVIKNSLFENIHDDALDILGKDVEILDNKFYNIGHFGIRGWKKYAKYTVIAGNEFHNYSDAKLVKPNSNRVAINSGYYSQIIFNNITKVKTGITACQEHSSRWYYCNKTTVMKGINVSDNVFTDVTTKYTYDKFTKTKCRDGKKEKYEYCDDGNDKDFDGCSKYCLDIVHAPPLESNAKCTLEALTSLAETGCAKGTSCIQVSGEAKCRKLVQIAGAECSYDDETKPMCGTGLACQITGTGTAVGKCRYITLEEDQKCSDTNMDLPLCAGGLICKVTGRNAVEGTCQPALAKTTGSRTGRGGRD